MANEYISKVVYGNQTLIDLTSDTVDASKVLTGYTAHGANGAPITGTCSYDADTSDANATASEILATRTAYVNGNKVTGTMTNRAGVHGVISSKTQTYSVPQGYHDGSGDVIIDTTEQAKIVAGNIKSGVTILGVTGTYSGEGGTGQAKTQTPYTDKATTVLPDSGYDYLTQVTVQQIYYNESANASGGLTVTIGTVSPS